MAKTPTESNAELHQPALPPVVTDRTQVPGPCTGPVTGYSHVIGMPAREAKRGFMRTQSQETPQLQQVSVGSEQIAKGRQVGQYLADFHRKQKPVPGTSCPPVLSFKFLLLRMGTEGLLQCF